MNKAEIISRHAQALKGQVGTSLAIDECEDIMANMMNEAINFIQCCTQLKDKYTPEFEDWVNHIQFDKKTNLYLLNNGYYTKDMLFDVWKSDEAE